MPRFSQRSMDKLYTCHIDLQRLFLKVVEDYDCTVLEGHRGSEAQDAAFKNGFSKLRFPNGKHNGIPSFAVDVAPYPIDWEDTDRFYDFGEYVMATAREMGLNIRWGGDWDGDGVYSDQDFNDLVHFEMVMK